MNNFNTNDIELGMSHLAKGKLTNAQANVRLKMEGVSEFPIFVFPQFIQDTILELYDNCNYNIDYTAAAILTALAGIIGNSFQLKVNVEWYENAALWVVIVGKSGQNKSAPLKTAFKSMVELQNRFDDDYEAIKSNYNSDSGDKKPTKKKLYSTDPTFEALIKMHKENANGIVLRPDEFKSFINNLVGYSGSSKQSNYLSIWDGAPISLDRKETESTSVKKPCVSIIGGIQDDVIASLKAKDIKDGFFERLLFTIPIRMEKRFIRKTQVNEYVLEKFHSKTMELLTIVLDKNEAQIVELSNEADEMFINELNKHVEPSNKDATISGILSKLDRYMLRFALVLEVSEKLLMGKPVRSITPENMYRAIVLKDYFYKNALKLNSMVLDVFEDNSKEGKVLKVLRAIGKKEFTNKEFILIADKLGVGKESYAYQLLSNSKLAQKLSRGVYETDVIG